MDKAKILRLCNEIEKEISEAWNSDVIEYCKAGHIVSFAQKIAAEITAPPKSNGDRIRQMTDEELADFFCQISKCCGNDASCSMCPIYDGCAQNVMCVERWLKQEVSEDERN